MKKISSQQIRQQYIDFFSSKNHKIVNSAPMVIKDDPTLMFTNAGMNQFKDIFLGNEEAPEKRVANTQKCLRVSGKHNDLEEVGKDTYHHTMFEMLGNWSFGDYFKKEAIDWAWELLTEVFKIEKNRLYVTVFGGDKADGLAVDNEAREIWEKHLPTENILDGSKNDNFWEMGDTGPCGPCSEIHVDIRKEDEREKVKGYELVNKDHPLVIEIWNLVFIQFSRLANGDLVPLPNKHVDTGMGFERLCMVLQGKRSNYDTDIFQPLINKTEDISGKKYGVSKETDIAFRVIADHLRAVSFSIADGQLPSNVRAGYVIRRILRRAIRYGFTYLGFKEPFIYLLVPQMVKSMGDCFPELNARQELITKVIREEEQSFLNTLETGINLLDNIVLELKNRGSKILDGDKAFLLYDTYGFPFDLTLLILSEHGLKADHDGFLRSLEKQKQRSRDAAKTETDDWIVVHRDIEIIGFTGYDRVEDDVKIIRYRKVTVKDKVQYQLVFNKTPFYPESGGQVGDRGYITDQLSNKKAEILDTRYENQLIIHITEKLPIPAESTFKAIVDVKVRQATAKNHTATHLLHYALRDILGSHVEQKGSLVHPDYLRFDFSHFAKMTSEEIKKVEHKVNKLILDLVPLDEKRDIAMQDAQRLGAISLFGEKYGDSVRVIRFADSVELCGGTHVQNTGEVGVFKIISESAIAAGIRRIEAITGFKAIEYYEKQLAIADGTKELLKNHKDPLKSLEKLIKRNSELEKELTKVSREVSASKALKLLSQKEQLGDIDFTYVHTGMKMQELKDIAFQLRNTESNRVVVFTTDDSQKAGIAVFVSQDLIKDKGLKANELVKQLSKLIEGGGGGQDFFSTAGGKNIEGLSKIEEKARELVLRRF